MRYSLFFFAPLLCHNISFAQDSAFLWRHSQNPSAASKEIPAKIGADRLIKFTARQVVNKDFVLAKDHFRHKVLCTGSHAGEICVDGNAFSLFEQFNEDYQLKAFLKSDYERNLMKLTGFDQGNVATVPWAGDYWPMYQGGLGARYADPKFPRSESFKINYAYYLTNYLKEPKADPEELQRLSPAEKYDLMLGDKQWSLTRSVWTEGKVYLDSAGKVETWFGICHGWAPAAFSIPEPQKAFDLDLNDGRGVMRVYPHDLKGMISQLWAQASFDYNFLGGRCNDKNPKTDSNGRVISSECFDINPSTWHLALIHWLGKERQSFVLDATYDYEVWNQPIASYQLSYFNPENQKIGALKDSIIPYSDLKRDPYKKYRSPDTRYLVGVISRIQYVVEESASQSDSISDPLDRLVSVSYYYDLELDKDYNIIGGEWYQEAHPDMLWKPQRGSLAAVYGEERLPVWDGLMPVPKEFFDLGVRGSAQKMPLSKILDKLIEFSRR
jgi:hypothetical protein